MNGVSKSKVSRLCEEIDERVSAFLERPIEGDWPYLWIDATYVKARQNGRVVSVAVIIGVGGNSNGRREMLGLDIGPSEAETFWTAFLRGRVKSRRQRRRHRSKADCHRPLGFPTYKRACEELFSFSSRRKTGMQGAIAMQT